MISWSGESTLAPSYTLFMSEPTDISMHSKNKKQVYTFWQVLETVSNKMEPKRQTSFVSLTCLARKPEFRAFRAPSWVKIHEAPGLTKGGPFLPVLGMKSMDQVENAGRVSVVFLGNKKGRTSRLNGFIGSHWHLGTHTHCIYTHRIHVWYIC